MKHHKQYIKRLKLQRDIMIMIIIMLLTVIIGSWYEQNRIISPCPERGCGVMVHTVYAQSPDMTTKEHVLFEGMRYFGAEHVDALEKLVFKESSFNPYAVNPDSGACGLFQFFPCHKMKCELSDIDCQIDKGLKYIKERYGNPSNAWEFHLEHGWY